jgi:hypothetical protein
MQTTYFCVQGDEEQTETQPRNTAHHVHSAHSLFPSCLCSAVIQIVNLLDDAAVSPDGNAVYEVAYQVFYIEIHIQGVWARGIKKYMLMF